MQHRKKALLLSIIPGLGQFYNKQWIKGLLFLLLGVSFFAVFGDLLNMGLWGLFTLGTEVPRDNSIFLLAEGIIAVIVTGFGLAVYYANCGMPTKTESGAMNKRSSVHSRNNIII